MQETLQALLGLQDIDRRIFKVEDELRRLPAELEQRKRDLDRRAAVLEERRGATHDLRTNIHEIDDVTTQQRQRLRKLEGEASKASRDAAMLVAFEHEIRGLKRTINQAEEDGLQLVERSEQIDAEIAELEASFAEEERVFTELRGNVEREIAAAEAKLAELKVELEAQTSGGINSEHLELYRRLVETREGEAMAELEGNVCQGCYVGIPKNLTVRLVRGVDLVQCPSCARILFARY